MLETIVAVCLPILVSYLVVGWWSIWRHLTHSPLLPFSLTKWLAGLGRDVQLDSFGSRADAITKFRFVDHRYQIWLEEVVDRGSTTEAIFAMFNKQRNKEIRNELARRKTRADDQKQ